MPGITLIDKIVPQGSFTGMVDAEQVLGGGDSGTLPDATISLGNITQFLSDDFIDNGSLVSLVDLTVDHFAANSIVLSTGEGEGIANNDVETMLPTSKAVKAYVDSKSHTDTVSSLTDTTITGTPADNEFLSYDTTSSKWINQTAAEVGLSIGVDVQAYDSTIVVDADIGSTVQAHDAGLASIAGLTTLADKMVYTTGADTYAVTGLTSFGRSILDDANEATFKATVNLEIDTDVQAHDDDLDAIAGLTSAADKGIQFTGSGTAGLFNLTDAGRALLDDETAADQRTTLGIDSSGTVDTTNASNIISGILNNARLSDSISIKDTIIADQFALSGKVTDVDGNIYQTVIIGKQEWMIENLKTTKYNDGTAITFVDDETNESGVWQNLSEGGYSRGGSGNDSDADYEDTYGYLYNWYAVDGDNGGGSDEETLAPTGWRIPTDQDWSILEARNDSTYVVTTLHKGTTNSTTTDKLEDSTKDFSDVIVGDLVHNITDTTYAKVDNITGASSGTIGLDDDIMTTGEEYIIYKWDDEWDGTGYRGDDAGSKLAGNAALWNDGNLENDSEFGRSGFNIIPGGDRVNTTGYLTNIGVYGYFWSSTEYDSNGAWIQKLNYDTSEIGRNASHKRNGFSVRCVRDAVLINFILDEDDMVSNSNISLVTQQSVKAYVDTQDSNIASDQLTFTNKTFDVEGTGNSISNIDVANFKVDAIITEAEDIANNDNDDTLPTSAAVKDYVDNTGGIRSMITLSDVVISDYTSGDIMVANVSSSKYEQYTLIGDAAISSINPLSAEATLQVYNVRDSVNTSPLLTWDQTDTQWKITAKVSGPPQNTYASMPLVGMFEFPGTGEVPDDNDDFGSGIGSLAWNKDDENLFIYVTEPAGGGG